MAKKYKDWADVLAEEIMMKIKNDNITKVNEIAEISFNAYKKGVNLGALKLADTLFYDIIKDGEKVVMTSDKTNNFQEPDDISSEVKSMYKTRENGTYKLKVEYFLNKDDIMTKSLTPIN